MKIPKITILTALLISSSLISQNDKIAIVPVPKEINIKKNTVCINSNISVFWKDPQINKLYNVLQEEILALTNKAISRANSIKNATLVLEISSGMASEEYQITFDSTVTIKAGTYQALTMGTVTFLQAISISESGICWNQGEIKDAPDFDFRGLLLDVARQKHSLENIKTIVTLCRWYKVNYLQLHLTDDQAFTFPSTAYPELPTENWAYTKEELKDLVSFATDRGIEIIPEFELPGHSGQLIKKMPEVFGFKDDKLNRNTVNMANEKLYAAAEQLYREIAEIFNTSSYIHIGGDEANFRGMEENSEIQQYLKENNLKNIEELYWQFINRMHEGVKKAGKKTIVWEGFSKDGNSIINKDITVMAWETLYQLPQDILEAGFTTINVSWKPLYVVNQRKWTPEEIFNWNIYRWENFWQVAPSFKPIQLDQHKGIIGTMMASWEQPEHVELSSLRHRIPALMEEAWGRSQKPSFNDFKSNMEHTDNCLNKLLTPIEINIDGLTYPDLEDGRKNEQDWFGDQLKVTLKTDSEVDIRYTLDSSKVNLNSNKYTEPLILKETSYLRYRAFKNNKPVGHEMLDYFELRPLKVDINGTLDIPLDQLWVTPYINSVRFLKKLKIFATPLSAGELRYAKNTKLLNTSPLYNDTIIIKEDTTLEIGLFKEGKLVGKSWFQKFEKVNR